MVDVAVEKEKTGQLIEIVTREIAAAGWKRAVTDYNEKAVFQVLINAIKEQYFEKPNLNMESALIFLNNHKNHTKIKRLFYPFVKFINLNLDRVSGIFKLF